MWHSSILDSLGPTSPHTRTRLRPSPSQRPAARCRPRLEYLEDRCLLSAVVRSDFFVDIVSTLPHYSGLPAQLDVHEVSPADRAPGSAVQAAILVSGKTIDAVTGFDLQYQDYSLQESMARAGIDTFAVNFLGWGLSTRFGLDDPKNASSSDQKTFLIPNPLDKTYVNPDPFHFTNTSALVDQLDAVVNDVRDRMGIQQVSLFAWSRGALVAGPYIELHPEKVKNVVFDAGSYNNAFPADPPNPLPQPGPSLVVQDRSLFESTWTKQVDSDNFPGELDPAILDPLWQSVMARDPLGSTWGANGLMRFPSVDYWGWNPAQHQASGVTVPALVMSGQLDTQVLPAAEVQLYNDLASEKKVLIKMDGASHMSVWEGSTSPTWKGPHETVQDAAVQWITSESYFGSTTGTFQVHADGRIDGVPAAKVTSVQVNDGSPQRSMVTRLTVTFSYGVTIDPSAFELRRDGGELVDLQVTTTVVAAKTVAVLTFVGPDVIGGSLADGSYTLTVRSDRVHDRWGRELDGDGDGSAGGDRVDSFVRLFGDSDGDGDVDAADRDLFRSAFKTSVGDAAYLWYFDFDADGDVDGHDNGEFNRRFGQY
jgi:pimeloyl-ACP methyl ester carboxylesterase